MKATDLQLTRARLRAERARARLTGTLVEMQARLRPAKLMEDAIGEMRQKAGESARDAVAIARAQPVATLGAVAALIAYLFRHRLIDAALGLFSRNKET